MGWVRVLIGGGVMDLFGLLNEVVFLLLIFFDIMFFWVFLWVICLVMLVFVLVVLLGLLGLIVWVFVVVGVEVEFGFLCRCLLGGCLVVVVLVVWVDLGVVVLFFLVEVFWDLGWVICFCWMFMVLVVLLCFFFLVFCDIEFGDDMVDW